ncbi:MAG: dicarboxylate/amino acid:cation symporter [Prevotellaceae bacterium]|jgi:Na+/H+-dicarboxylate symporter|nr:dicarboxylate/amino acid:cation symporter [Prevotellaceae bacterium]
MSKSQKNKQKRIPLYVQILIGMIVGVIIGFVALGLNGIRFVQNWIYPWGQIFIRLLQLIAIPLVFISLIKGIIGLKNIHSFSRMGGKTIAIYMCTTIIAVVLGLSAGLLMKPGKLVDKTQIAHIQEQYQSFVEEKKHLAEEQEEEGPLAFLENIIPDNIFNAAGDNSKMLQVIFFALFFGLAALTITPVKIEPLIVLFDGLNDVIIRMVDYIIYMAPYGVAALMAGLIADFNGDISVFSALGVYALTIIVSLFILIFCVYPLLLRLFTKIKIREFMKSIYPVQMFAFTTSSSAATLPVTMDVVEKKLGVSQETASFVLPVGTTINMDGTSCYQAIAVIFISQVLGMDLTVTQLFLIVALTVLSSIGTPGIPGGSFVILTMVLTSVGIPAEGLALIIGIDRPLDMLRTSVNVTGDAVTAAIVDGK